MMCNENENNLINLDFNQVNDESNWLHAITNTVETIGGKLKINSDSSTATFFRQIGSVDAANNRIRLKCNLEVEKTDVTGPSSMEVVFRLVTLSTILYESSFQIDSLTDGIKVAHLLEREFVYDTPITSPIALQILIPTGWEHTLYLSDMEISDLNFCQDNVRTYFVVDQLLEDGVVSQAGGIQLLEWKVDGVETLTTDFFNDTNIVGGVPLSEWNYAKADIDGSNRVAELVAPNTFNPFSNEFKLKFDTTNSFHGGKPTATINGNDYGAGIMQIGFDKPAILNGDLTEKKGAFFVDINYDVSLKVVFNVIINKRTKNLFTNPTYLRKYTIEWDAQNCLKRFYYVEDGVEVDQYVNGFLVGLTGPSSQSTIVDCDYSFLLNGAVGNFTYFIDFGEAVGQAGINYFASGIPDKFVIEWDGNIVGDSGYVGDSVHDSLLIAAGVSPTEINTASPSSGTGILQFNKTTPQPTMAKITVFAPIIGTGWRVDGICVNDGNTGPGTRLQVTRGKCTKVFDGTTIWQDVYIDNQLNVGNGGVLYTDAALTIPFDGGDLIGNFWRIQTVIGLIYNSVYSISNVGVISGATSCGLSGGPGGSILSMTSSFPQSNGGGFGGTLDVSGGEPNEVLNLSFGVFFDVDGEFTGANFGSPVNVASIDNSHLSRNGTITLDSNGNATATYQITDHNADGVAVVVTLTGRNSSEPMPSSIITTNISI